MEAPNAPESSPGDIPQASPIKACKSTTFDAPSQPAVKDLSEVQLGSRKTTNKSNVSRVSAVSRPDSFLQVGTRPSIGGGKVIASTHNITAEWLTEVYAMRGFLEPGGKITSVNVKPLGEGEGVMGLLAICTVELENPTPQAPLQFVAKFSPIKTSMPGFLLRAIFGAEAHWYNDMYEEDQCLGRPAAFFIGAKLFHKRWWKRKPVFCMLVEMMPKPLYSRTSGCDNLAHLRLVVQSLAGFHAHWHAFMAIRGAQKIFYFVSGMGWNAKKEPPLEWVSRPGQDNFGLMKNALIFAVKKGFPALEKCFPEAYAPVIKMKPVILKKLKWFIDQVFAPPLTLCHGDVHLDNIFFDEAFPTGLKFIDFGNIQIAQAGFDLAYFMGQNIDPELRRASEKELMQLYHERLVRDGVEGYSLEDCWRAYRMNLFRVLINVMYVTYDQFVKDAVAKRGMFAAEPTKEMTKLRATYDATNRRIAQAIADAEFDKFLEEEGVTSSNPCKFLPFCA